MSSFLTISEFASLRNVNLNSLRYYEKIGLLIPAFIDPETKYRYYLPKQIVTLDCILMCIKLGIPLKDLLDYMDEDNSRLDLRKLFNDCRDILAKKITDLQNNMEVLQYAIEYVENAEHTKHTDRRQISTRYYLTEQIAAMPPNFAEYSKDIFKQFKYAERNNMQPLPIPNMLIDQSDVQTKLYSAVQVLLPNSERNIVCIPSAQFRYKQLELESVTDLKKELTGTQYKNQMLIVTNIMVDGLFLNKCRVEIQISD